MNDPLIRWIEPQAYYPDLCDLFAENIQGDAFGPRPRASHGARSGLRLSASVAIAIGLTYALIVGAMLVTP